METSKFRRHAPVPKIPLRQRASSFVPVLPEHELGSLLTKLTPPERRALRKIVDGADLLVVDGQKFLLAPVDTKTLDVLATFEADMEDRELAPDDEEETDDDRYNDGPADWGGIDSDDEHDFPSARLPFIQERTVQYHRAIHRSNDGGYSFQVAGHEISSSLELKHPGRDDDELRRVQRFARGWKA